MPNILLGGGDPTSGLAVTGTTTVLQPRVPAPPPAAAAAQGPGGGRKGGARKPGRTLVDPAKEAQAAAAAAAAAARQSAAAGIKVHDVVSGKIMERFTHLSEAFLSFDRNRTGTITQAELARGLRNWGFDLEQKSLDAICKNFVHTASAAERGKIDYQAFAAYFHDALSSRGSLTGFTPRKFVDHRHASPEAHGLQFAPAAAPAEADAPVGPATTTPAPSVSAVIDEVERELRIKIAEQFRSVQHAFLFFDADRSGRISMDEFAAVLKRYGIKLNAAEMEELRRRTVAEAAREAAEMPARKKRDVIFGGEDDDDDDVDDRAASDAEGGGGPKKALGIKYEEFVSHFGKLLDPPSTDNEFNQLNQQHKVHRKRQVKPKRGKNVGHTGGHKIFGSKATATEGKQAQRAFARGVFNGLDECHDALVFHDSDHTGSLSAEAFAAVMRQFGVGDEDVAAAAARFGDDANQGGVDHAAFSDAVADCAGKVASRFFAESEIILQTTAEQAKTAAANDAAGPAGPEEKVAKQLFVREGLSRVVATWKLFDRASSGKIQGGEFINALRNTRSARALGQRASTALSELYDLDGTGRCDFVAFSRSFRKDLVRAASKLKHFAGHRRRSLLVNTERRAETFWREKAEAEAQARAQAETARIQAEAAAEAARRKAKRQPLLPDGRLRRMAGEKKSSPRFRPSFDAHNLVGRVRSSLGPKWRTLKDAFHAADRRNTGTCSPSRFARVVLAAAGVPTSPPLPGQQPRSNSGAGSNGNTGTVTKLDVERLALAFVVKNKEGKMLVSYERFMRQLVLEPLRPSSANRSAGRRPRTSRVTTTSGSVGRNAKPTKPRPGTAATTPGSKPLGGSLSSTKQQVRGRRGSKRESDVMAVKELSEACKLSVYGRWKMLRRVYAKMDAKRRGSVATATFCETLQKHAFAVTPEDFAVMKMRFGTGNGRSRIRYHDFLRYVLQWVTSSSA